MRKRSFFLVAALLYIAYAACTKPGAHILPGLALDLSGGVLLAADALLLKTVDLRAEDFLTPLVWYGYGLYLSHFEPTLSVKKLGIPQPDGYKVEVYMFSNTSMQDEDTPAIIEFHGGCWTYGSPIISAELSREFVRFGRAKVFAVNYRLVPRVKFPTPVLDGIFVTKWIVEHAKELRVQPDRISLLGESAGANLVSAINLFFASLRVSDAPLGSTVASSASAEYSDALDPTNFARWQPKHQFLVYPALATDFTTESAQKYTNAVLLTRELMITSFYNYMSHPSDVNNVFFAPGNLWHPALSESDTTASSAERTLPSCSSVAALQVGQNSSGLPLDECLLYNRKAAGQDEAASGQSVFQRLAQRDPRLLLLTKLPRTYIVTAEYDVLRDDGIRYGRLLQSAGVHVVMDHYDTFHGFLNAPFTDHGGAVEKMAEFLRS